MESSGLSSNASDSSHHRWASIAGTTIAILTLTLPLLIIAYSSSPSNLEPLTQTNYSFPRTEDE